MNSIHVSLRTDVFTERFGINKFQIVRNPSNTHQVKTKKELILRFKFNSLRIRKKSKKYLKNFIFGCGY